MRHLFIVLLLFASISSHADNLNKWLRVEGLKTVKPILAKEKNVNNQVFDVNKLVLFNSHSVKSMTPTKGLHFLNIKDMPTWKEVSAKDIVSSSKKSDKKYISYYASYIEVESYSKFAIDFDLYVPTEIYVDGKLRLKSYAIAKKKAIKKTLKLNLLTGKHSIIVKTLSGKEKLFKTEVKFDNDKNYTLPRYSTSPERGMKIEDIMNGTKLSRLSISPKGDYVLISKSRFTEKTGKSERWYELMDSKTNDIIYSFRKMRISGLKWMPNTNNLSWLVNTADCQTMYKYDVVNNKISIIAKDLHNVDYYTWANNNSYFIYGHSKNYSEKNWSLRKVHGIEDRKPYFRYRTSLYKYDMNTKERSLINWGNKSLNLQDISKDSKYIIVSNSRPTYTEYPFSKQNVYMVDINSMKVDTLFKNRSYSLSCQFSPNGKELLIQAGPSAFGKKGENIKKGQMANNYDGQLYIYNLKSKKVKAITRKFNPSIGSAKWVTDNSIKITAEDTEYVYAFNYSIKAKKFSKIDVPGDVLRGFSISADGSKAAFISCTVNSPYKAYITDFTRKGTKLISFPEQETYKNVNFSKVREWNYADESGTRVTGRYYLPRNFDSNRLYPVIVYYYGGTSPVSRYFGGRYPFNLFAANGYVVYVIQPSGTTGYGQEFSARHQNNWCKITADEIIKCVKDFTAHNSFADKRRVACMGASYGGFTTEFLQTQTDIFKCAISHAGISNISEYWGNGYWGYQYSTEASGHSYPWNRKDIYVDQSALFNADKIKTPMLLLHGTADVNVPTTQSIQLYTALKLLGNDVELVFIKDSDHIVVDYKQRIKWNNTIISYFDKYLKGQENWWNDMYPTKNL